MADLQQSLTELRAARDAALQKFAELAARQWAVYRKAMADIERAEIERIKASLTTPVA